MMEFITGIMIGVVAGLWFGIVAVTTTATVLRMDDIERGWIVKNDKAYSIREIEIRGSE